MASESPAPLPPVAGPAPSPGPPPGPSPAQDAEHLRLLSIFYYILAGCAGLFSLLPVIHLLVGFGLLAAATVDPAAALPGALVGWIFVAIALFVITLGLGFAVALVIAGRSLAERRRYTFCLVVAGVSCLVMPLGTALGIFTILVLIRPSVRALFPDAPAPVPAPPPVA
jgi:hypothetical protein